MTGGAGNMTSLIIKYSLFAVIAILVNLGMQRLVLLVVDNWLGFINDWLGLGAAILVGTGAGLVTKYLLDRRWIFYDRLTSMSQQGQQFFLYSVTGVLTTLLFWGSELGAYFIWQTEFAREAGALFGLTLGYIAKYQLDKRFVFNRLGIGAAL
jgi:putative flippase GtrA